MFAGSVLCFAATAAAPFPRGVAQLRAVSENGLSDSAVRRAALDCFQGNRNYIPGLEGVLAIARGVDATRSLSLRNPLYYFAVFPFDVKRQQTVGIGPKPCLNGPFQGSCFTG